MKLLVPFIIIFLSGCGGGVEKIINDFIDDIKKSRFISVNINDELLLEKKQKSTFIEDSYSSIKKSNDNITHEYITTIEFCSYQLSVIDDIGERVLLTDICIDQTPTLSVEVTGDAKLLLNNTLNNNVFGVSHDYTVTGSTTLSKDETSAEIKLINDEWSFITIDNHNKIKSVEVISIDNPNNTLSMKLYHDKEISYYGAYISKDAIVRIIVSDDIIFEESITYEKNKHYPLALNPVVLGDLNLTIVEDWNLDQQKIIDAESKVTKSLFISSNWINDELKNISNNYMYNDLLLKGEFNNDITTQELFVIPKDNLTNIKLVELLSSIETNYPIKISMRISTDKDRDNMITITLDSNGDIEIYDSASFNDYYYDDYYQNDYFITYSWYSDQIFIKGDQISDYNYVYYYYDYNEWSYFYYACELYVYTCSINDFINRNENIKIISDVVVSTSNSNFEITRFSLPFSE